MTMSPLPRVHVLATGGSIAGVGASRTDFVDYPNSGRKFTVAELLARIPEVATLAEVRAEQILNVGSNEVLPAHWLVLARRIAAIFREDPQAAGVVVTHGTATLEETAYFLSLTCRDARPVVVTGAQRPPTAISTDADINLLDAVRVAADPGSRGRGGLVVLNNEIQAAREVTKTNSFRLETFRSNEIGFLGYADADGRVAYYRSPTRRHTAASEFDIATIDTLPRVDITLAYAGVDGVVVRALLAAGVQGIVSAGLGNGASAPAHMDALREAQRAGIPVVIATQAGNGRVVPMKKFVEDGMLLADNLSPRKARVLLMLALTRTRDPVEIQQILSAY
jgi:L-asparaginase